MSVQDISQLDRPAGDELVPSRYALKVGDIDVLVISDPAEAAAFRKQLLRELAASGESLVATHLPFPSVCRVALAGNAFRCVPTVWDY